MNTIHALLCLLITGNLASSTVLKIGVLLQEGDVASHRAIRMAVDHVNENKGLLRRGITIDYVVRKVRPGEVLSVLRQTCDLTEIGVAALIGPSDCLTGQSLLRIASSLHIPLLQVNKMGCPISQSSASGFSFTTEYSIKTLSQAYAFYMKTQKQGSLVIVYGDEMGAANIQEFENQLYHNHQESISYRPNIIYQIEKNQTGYPLIGNTAKHLHYAISSNFIIQVDTVIVFAKPKTVILLLKKMQNAFPRESEIIKWIVVSDNDFLPSDLRSIKHVTHSKVSVIQSFKNNTTPAMKRFIEKWNEYKQKECPLCNYSIEEAEDITLNNFYIYDGIIHLSTALTRDMLDGNFMSPASLKCRNEPPRYWDGGDQIMRTIKRTNSSGGALTSIAISKEGYNEIAQIEVITKQEGNHLPFQRVMIWNSTNPDESILFNRIDEVVLKIVTIEEAPFVNIKRSPDGQKHFHGFCIELIDRLAANIGFSYELYEVEDNKYGVRLENGSWNGLIGDILKEKADIVVAGMTITSDREKVVDFTKRFMDYSVGIVIKKPQMTASFFSFIEPFHPSVWFCILSSLILVVVFIYIINKISPNRQTPWKSSESELDDTFTFYSVFWFAYSSLMQQGPDLTKPTVPVRIVVAFWWFFTLIVVSSYTANLTAFLTVQRMDTLVRSFRDLADQHQIKYGTVVDTSIFNYIMKKAAEESDETSLFKTMSRVINKTENQIKTVSEGLDRASQGGFAFLWDVPVIEYEIENHASCDLTSIDDSIYEKGYGFALRPNSNFKDKLSLGILDLQDNGEIARLRNKWWPKIGTCGTKKKPQPAAAELTLQNFTGVFFVLAGGLFLGILCAAFEIFVHIGQGKEYPPTIETLKKNEMEEEKRRPNEIHFVLSKKALVRQLVDDIINDEYTNSTYAKQDEKQVETSTELNNLSSNDQESLLKSRQKERGHVTNKGLNYKTRNDQCALQRRRSPVNSNTSPLGKTFKNTDMSLSSKTLPSNRNSSPKRYEFFPPPPFPISFETLPKIQPISESTIQPQTLSINKHGFLQKNSDCTMNTSRLGLYGTLPSVVESDGDEIEPDETGFALPSEALKRDGLFAQELPSLFKKSSV